MKIACCRFCGAALRDIAVDLGMTPLANAFVEPAAARAMEPFYPLVLWVCGDCRLVQLEMFETPQRIFSDYLYFSSYSESWLQHARTYADEVSRRFGLAAGASVVEIGSNDGYLLQYFMARGMNVLGVEPAANVAAAATVKGIATETAFFGTESARRLKAAGVAPDLMVANNVLAHVDDLNDFVAAFALLLKPEGVLSIECPHLLRLLTENQFDTIYHEHFSYFSLHVIRRVLAFHGLRVFDVESLPTHGGSLRIFATHAACPTHGESAAVAHMLHAEVEAGLESGAAYQAFAQRVVEAKCALLRFLIGAWAEGKTVFAYGAPAKGNTLLNYCGIGPELIPFTVDRSPHKQGLLLPGTHIPVRAPDAIMQARPDYLLILPWNLRDEVMAQMSTIRGWGGRFVTPIPTTQIWP
jgi:2-polyprenyl-3-methyl-5-hydroxy-6-metoxy-1,4-benzoquinol methylase